MRCWYRLGLVCGLLALACGVHAGEVTLELRPDVLLEGGQIRLVDVARIDATDGAYQRQLESLVVGRAPLVGHLEQRTRAELDLLLRSQAFRNDQSIVWRGAAAVKIRRASQMLAADQLLDVARRHVLDHFGAGPDEMQIRLDGVLPEVAAPQGALQLTARMAPTARARARMAVWVDVVVQGSVYRSVVVPLLIDIRDSVDPAPAGMVLRGEEVRLQSAVAGILIETGAVAQADGKLGQRIPVRPARSNETIMAWVAAPGVVRMEKE
jgi:hypothetical protein